VADGQATALREFVVPLVRDVHVAPPSALVRIVPAAPTAVHVPGVHATPFRAFDDPLVPDCQVEPSVVKRTTAAPNDTAPTAAQAVEDVHETPLSAVVVPLVCGSQVRPPFVVARIVPPPPTA